MMALCSFCDSTGEIVVTRLGVNPFSGVPVHDPQNDDIVPCPRCSRPREQSAGPVLSDVLAGINTDSRMAA